MNSKAFRAEITITGVYIFETPSYHVSVRFLSGIYCFECCLHCFNTILLCFRKEFSGQLA